MHRGLKLFAALLWDSVSIGSEHDHGLPVKHGEMGIRADAWMPGAVRV